MKRILVLSLLTCSMLAACASHPPRHKGFNPPPGQPSVTGTAAEHSDVVVPPVPEEPKPTPAPEAQTEATPPPAPPKPAQRTAPPIAKPVPGKPGYVYSPSGEGAGLIDVRGYPPGAEVKDPWAPGKTFLVP